MAKSNNLQKHDIVTYLVMNLELDFFIDAFYIKTSFFMITICNRSDLLVIRLDILNYVICYDLFTSIRSNYLHL